MKGKWPYLWATLIITFSPIISAVCWYFDPSGWQVYVPMIFLGGSVSAMAWGWFVQELKR